MKIEFPALGIISALDPAFGTLTSLSHLPLLSFLNHLIGDLIQDQEKASLCLSFAHCGPDTAPATCHIYLL